MLAIRMQRVGRKGHPEFRVVVQDARLTPTSGRIVARVGHMNPHTKTVTLDKEKVEYYLSNGAQPSPRVVRMLQSEKVTLPTWVEIPSTDKKHSIKSAEKLRRNRPEEPKAEEAPVEEPVASAEPVEEPAAPVTEEVAAEDPKEEAPVEEASAEPETEKTEA
jgi:small subunit ribosomal protein S16